MNPIFESKTALRRKPADLPTGEKLTLLDALREGAIATRHATPISYAADIFWSCEADANRAEEVLSGTSADG